MIITAHGGGGSSSEDRPMVKRGEADPHLLALPLSLMVRLPGKVVRRLARAGIVCLGQLSECDEARLAALPLDAAEIEKIREVLRFMGLPLGGE